MRSTMYPLHRKASHFSFNEFMKRRGTASLITFVAWLMLLAFLFVKFGLSRI